MGCTAKITMPLLSTLAALVIIVHTAEENYDLGYHEISQRPRILDLEPHNYDQSWGVVDVEPVMTPTMPQNQNEWNDGSPDQPIRRRRRKRKRRPQNELVNQENPIILDEQPQEQQPIMEMTRRRRKKVNPDITGEIIRPSQPIEESADKPYRRRGYKRKRPSVVGSWPEFSEFNGQRNNRQDPIVINENKKSKDIHEFENKQVNNEDGIIVESETQHLYRNEPYVEEKNNHDGKSEQIKLESDKILQADKSISEISSESLNPTRSSNILKSNDKMRDKTDNATNDVNSSQENEPLDPASLKALLKKSSGKSLSEILQQNNLSLSDLLHGKAKALSILQERDASYTKDNNFTKSETNLLNSLIENVQSSVMDEMNEQLSVVTEGTIDKKLEYTTTMSELIHKHTSKVENEDSNDCTTTEENIADKESTSERIQFVKMDYPNSEVTENIVKENLRRRFPIGTRRRLRMKTTTTIKPQVSRDLITSTSQKYKNNRNVNKSKEWKEVLAAMLQKRPTSREVNVEHKSDHTKIVLVSSAPETTTEELYETTTDPSSAMNTDTTVYADSENIETLNTADSKISSRLPEMSSPAATTVEEEVITERTIVYEKTKSPLLKLLVNSSELRRHSYNNRLKRKRLKQKEVKTEEHEVKDIFGSSHFVSASEFIEKAQTKPIKTETEDYTTLEDFMTTEPVPDVQTTPMKSTTTKIVKTTTAPNSAVQSAPIPTEESAKYEIEEILNDIMTSARLSQILQERNMTLTELVQHRERGSSHVHLADIFHNTSKEPNPPEPFLSKSLIEPISREIYPLRALLEANLHDPKTTTIDTNSIPMKNHDIPVVMDFGNNVNENGENMGIISLFNNFTKVNSEINTNTNQHLDDDGEKINILQKIGTERESRTLNSEKDAMIWNDLISLMQKNQQQIKVDTIEVANSPKYGQLKNMTLEDTDNDGLIVLEDLQQLKNFDSRPSSDELLEIKLYENTETPTQKPIEYSVTSTTKSVTIATVSIIGLALTLFLLTYATLKWKQQCKIYHKKPSKEDERVPTPVFESRKSHKIHSSIRSKSPMISSNIYSIDTIDTHAGNESPEYMWDTLRKPFQ